MPAVALRSPPPQLQVPLVAGPRNQLYLHEIDHRLAIVQLPLPKPGRSHVGGIVAAIRPYRRVAIEEPLCAIGCQ